MASLHWADWVIFVSFLLVSMGIGVYHSCTGGKQRSTQEFIMANRKLQVIPTMLSLLVSFQSAILILGMTAEMFTRGIQQWLMVLVCMSFAILIVERLIVPWMYCLKLTSVYEYFDLRFQSKLVRVFAASLGILSGVLYMGVAMFAPSIALETATGLSKTISIPVMAVVCVIYTTLGGMRAVIWTDVLQYLVMMGGILAILIKGGIVSGGLGNAMRVFDRENRLNWIDINPDPTVRHTLWGFLFGWTLNWTFLYGLQQASVQRYSSTGSLKAARLTLLLNIPAYIIMGSISAISGIFVFTYYADVVRCDPLASKVIFSPNQILPDFVRRVFSSNIGFNGLFLATLYSGALSSVSSSLSGAAANTWMDILQWLPGLRDLPDSKATTVNRVLVIVYGVLATGFAFMSAIVPGPITQVSLALIGAVGGPLFSMFLLGGLLRFVEWKGAFVGGFVSLVLNIWLSIGSISVPNQHPILPPAPVDMCLPPINITEKSVPSYTGLQRLYTLSYLWYVPLSLIVSILVGSIVSFIVNRFSVTKSSSFEDTEQPKKLFINWHSCLSFSGDDEPDTHQTAPEKYKDISEVFHTNPAFNTREEWTEEPPLDQSLNQSIRSDGTYGPENPPKLEIETNM